MAWFLAELGRVVRLDPLLLETRAARESPIFPEYARRRMRSNLVLRDLAISRALGFIIAES